jgi:hypothetical protein
MKILLRFRDTSVIDTIDAHERIVKARGHVWWGWWKKESEPDRYDLLSKVNLRISDFEFYLFDKSTDRFYMIAVDKISFSNENVTTPDSESTPPYYSDALLPLWLRITKVKQISKEAFIELFKKIPLEDFTFFTDEDIVKDQSSISRHSRVKLQSDLILHLSDIHFGQD